MTEPRKVGKVIGKPTRKVQAAGVGGAAALVVVFVLQQAGVDVSPELASAITLLLSAGAGYLRRDA